MLAPKLTLVISPPRCGSMWLYNAARLVLGRCGLTVKPDDIAVGLDDVAYTMRDAAEDRDTKTVYVVKTHAVVGGRGDGVLAATALRDPRDMAMSLEAFAADVLDEMSFPRRVAQMVAVYQRIEALWGDGVFRARFVDIVDRPAVVVAQLRAALGGQPNAEDDAAVAEALSPDAVSRIIAGVDADDGRSMSLDALGAARRMDLRTGFQTGHIGDRATEKWRGVISADDLARIADAHGDWLAANGFATA